jgi:hypothetical protein
MGDSGSWNGILGHAGTANEDDLLVTNCTFGQVTQEQIKLYKVDDASDNGTSLISVVDSDLTRTATSTYANILVDAAQETLDGTLDISGSTIAAFADDETAIQVNSGVFTVELNGNTIKGQVDFTAAAGASGDNNDFLSMTEAEAIAAGYTPGANDTFVPEPATMSLLALGGIALIRRRK